MFKKNNERIALLEQLLKTAPTAWHLCDLTSEILQECGFLELEESARWRLQPGGKYFLTRNGSALFAFVMPHEELNSTRIMGSHSDSPGLKVKPHPDQMEENICTISLEMYGGPLLSSWLNRDCKIAGRVITETKEGTRKQQLVDLENLSLTIPQLAIHLDKGVNDQGPKLDKQKHLIAMAACNVKPPKGKGLLESILSKLTGSSNFILAHDLFLVPTEPPARLGEKNNLLASYRLDNLTGFHASLVALLCNSDPLPSSLKLLVCWDNEEIGSHTAQGAASPFVSNLLERIFLASGGDREDFLASLPRSLCVSVDVAHAWYPGYSDRYEPNHKPLLGKGPVLKINANQRYASEAETCAEIVHLARKSSSPLQKVVNHGNIPGGSTIGPHFATATTIPTVDIGIPLMSMHSTRELIHLEDQLNLCNILEEFLLE